MNPAAGAQDSTMDLTRLHDLMLKIRVSYPFDAAHYPELKGADVRKTLEFAVEHSLMHSIKSLGTIAAESERADHGGQMDHGNLYKATAKMVINVLNLANAIGVSAEELAIGIRHELDSHR